MLTKRVAISLVIMTAPFSAGAAELRIIDGSGLIRASANLSEKERAEVRISQAGFPETNLTLRNIDGLRPEIKAECPGPDTCIFRQVPDGTWLIAPGSGNGITDVTIAK